MASEEPNGSEVFSEPDPTLSVAEREAADAEAEAAAAKEQAYEQEAMEAKARFLGIAPLVGVDPAPEPMPGPEVRKEDLTDAQKEAIRASGRSDSRVAGKAKAAKKAKAPKKAKKAKADKPLPHTTTTSADIRPLSGIEIKMDS